MAYQNGVGGVAKALAEFFSQIDRTVLPTGTADGNGQITAGLIEELGNPGIQERLNRAQLLLGFRQIFQKIGNRLVAAG